MAEKSFNQEFEGYWREINKSSLSTYSGVYIVQSCIHNKKEGTVSLKKLIYIGKADNIKERVDNHERLNEWLNELGYGEELCYSSTAIHKLYNERVEATLINSNQPIVNTEYKDSFQFDTTHINSSGRYSTLKENITVKRH